MQHVEAFCFLNEHFQLFTDCKHIDISGGNTTGCV